VSRYLVVAHETVTKPELLEQIKAVAERDQEAEFVLLVPATPVRHLLYRQGSQGEADAVARERADDARGMFAEHGIVLAAARVGSGSPEHAIDEELRSHPGYSGIVISTLPPETSRWLRMDLPRKIEKYGLPVIHVRAPLEWPG
jgi:hypothetical protein